MTLAHRISNLAGVVVPLLAVLVAIVLLRNTLVGWSDIVVLALTYAVTGFGVIRATKAAGLAWNVVEITPERQREKLAAPNVATPA